MSKTKLTAFATLATAFIGRAVLQADKETAAETKFTIARLDGEKMAATADGKPAEYVVLTKDGEDAVVVRLHPKNATKLFENGAYGQLKLVPTAEELAAAATAEAAGVEGTATGEAAAPAEPTKKDRTIAIFTKMRGEGKERKDVIAALIADLGLSKPCANTYYQNCKSGAWTAPAATTAEAPAA